MAVNQFPHAFNPAKYLRYTYPHIDGLWHISDLDVRDLEPRPETYITGVALLEHFKVAHAVVAERCSIREIALRNIAPASHRVSAGTMKAGHALVRNNSVKLGTVAPNIGTCCLLA